MKLTTFIKQDKYVLANMIMLLLLFAACASKAVIADSMTYSPEQWPRHWNTLINETQQQNNHYRQSGYASQKPMRSPMWGMAPVAKKKPRRTLRPEYNTNTHVINYSGQNFYGQNSYPVMNGYGLANPYASPLLVPGLMPGLGAPGIPYITNPYGMNPYMHGAPFPGYRW